MDVATQEAIGSRKTWHEREIAEAQRKIDKLQREIAQLQNSILMHRGGLLETQDLLKTLDESPAESIPAAE